MQYPLQILVAIGADADRFIAVQAVRADHPGAVIHEVPTCVGVMAALTSGRFDCAFLDRHLPDGDSLTCLTDIRAAGVLSPVVFLTDKDSGTLAEDAIRAGATDAIAERDLTPQLLGHCLRRALRYRDIQAQVRRSEEELHLRDRAIAAASNGIIICDPSLPDCPIIYCNPAFTTATGYTTDEVIGRNCRFLQGERTDPVQVQEIRDCMREERECLVILCNYKKDGTLWWNELTVSPVRDAAGRVTHFIGVQTDITQRREAEESLRLTLLRQRSFVRDMFASVTDGRLILCSTPGDLPAKQARFDAPVPLSRSGGIRDLRVQALRAGIEAGLPEYLRHDLETAVGEAAMNAVVHAGSGTGQVFVHERGAVQVWVEDAGKGIAVEDLPNATLQRGYSSAGTLGHGFKMILKTVERVHLLTGDAGTTVVLEMERDSRGGPLLFP